MSPKAGPGAAKPCPECKLITTTSYQRWLDEPEKFCYAANSGKVLTAKLACAKKQIVNLKAELAATNERQAETARHYISGD